MTIPATEHPHPILLVALEDRWKTYRLELKRCHAEFSKEAVHDLRVATRRMLALIQLLNSISPRPRLRKLIQTLKDQLDEFDNLRDTQVILAKLSEILQEFPHLSDFQKYLQHSEERMLRSLRKRLKKLDITETAKRIRKTRESIASNFDSGLESQIMQAVDDAFLRVKQRYNEIDPVRPATIHRVRVAFKSLRYMVEIIHPVLQDLPAGNIKRMNGYQSLMGEIQDADVFAQTLDDYLEHASLSDPEPVRRYLERRHADAISAYTVEKNQLDTFWRPTPDQPFPWENVQ